MCGFIPFCCGMKKWNAKTFTIIGLSCNVLKLIFSFLGVFLFLNLSIIAGALSLNIFELIFTFANLIFLIIIIIKIGNGQIFTVSNKSGKILCIIALVFSGIIIVLRSLIFILGLVFYVKEDIIKISTSDWLLFIIPTLIVLAIEIIHFLAVNYLYKLIKLPTDLSYNDYIGKGQNVDQVSVTIANTQTNQNPPMFPYNNPNQIPSTNQQNDETLSNKNIN